MYIIYSITACYLYAIVEYIYIIVCHMVRMKRSDWPFRIDTIYWRKELWTNLNSTFNYNPIWLCCLINTNKPIYMYMYIQNVQQNNSRSYKWNKMLLTPNCLSIMYMSFVRRKYEHLTSVNHEWCWKKNFTLKVHVSLCLTLWQCVIAMNHFIIQYSHGGT